MKAIETRYAGCRFRSRLEARWAVFFDALNIEWQYEPQGYQLQSGRQYLPDFFLPGGWSRSQAGLYLEIKGAVPEGAELERVGEFSEIPIGDDRLGLAETRIAIGDIPRSYSDLWLWEVEREKVYAPSPSTGKVELRMGAGWQLILAEDWLCLFGRHEAHLVARALEAARSARFEHGERGR